MEFPGEKNIENPLIDLRYEIDISAAPEQVWPWVKQLGYHRGGWYIDTWWDKFIQQYVWPRIVPKEMRGVYKAPADEIIPEFQRLTKGETVPDGPPGSAYYDVLEIQENRLLLLLATTHFNFMAPRWVYKTRFAPRGKFCWAFFLEEKNKGETRLTSWWRAEGYPKTAFRLLKPLLVAVDSAHQKQILQGIKRRVERRSSVTVNLIPSS